jgi:hypothetical protein
MVGIAVFCVFATMHATFPQSHNNIFGIIFVSLHSSFSNQGYAGVPKLDGITVIYMRAVGKTISG